MPSPGRRICDSAEYNSRLRGRERKTFLPIPPYFYHYSTITTIKLIQIDQFLHCAIHSLALLQSRFLHFSIGLNQTTSPLLSTFSSFFSFTLKINVFRFLLLLVDICKCFQPVIILGRSISLRFQRKKVLLLRFFHFNWRTSIFQHEQAIHWKSQWKRDCRGLG